MRETDLDRLPGVGLPFSDGKISSLEHVCAGVEVVGADRPTLQGGLLEGDLRRTALEHGELLTSDQGASFAVVDTPLAGEEVVTGTAVAETVALGVLLVDGAKVGVAAPHRLISNLY